MVYLALGDGTLLMAWLDDNDAWKLEVVSLGAGTLMAKLEAGPDPGIASDRMTLTNPSHLSVWALMGSSRRLPGWVACRGYL